MRKGDEGRRSSFRQSNNVSLALRLVDGATYATVQSLLNQSVRHTSFGALFFGGVAVPALALALNWRHKRTVSFWLLAAAGLLYLAGIVIFTSRVNLPLNMYTESWNPQALPNDWIATRDAWERANGTRVVVSMLSFALAPAALTLRASAARTSAARPIDAADGLITCSKVSVEALAPNLVLGIIGLALGNLEHQSRTCLAQSA